MNDTCTLNDNSTFFCITGLFYQWKNVYVPNNCNTRNL